MDDDPELRSLVDLAQDEGLGTIELAMMQATSQSDDKDWRALSWMMARRFPQEYGDKKEVEITAKKADGIPEVIAMIEQTNEIISDED
jgi:basic membrane lipoprotein Med (substrate-binding protein (PBP1-ABC) superfamily)